MNNNPWINTRINRRSEGQSEDKHTKDKQGEWAFGLLMSTEPLGCTLSVPKSKKESFFHLQTHKAISSYIVEKTLGVIAHLVLLTVCTVSFQNNCISRYQINIEIRFYNKPIRRYKY